MNRWLFSAFFLLFFFFPSDHGFREIGIGSEGMRILLPDVFCLLIIIIALANPKGVVIPRSKKFLLPFFIFMVLVFYSLIRGMGINKGLAIGDARWFLSIIFIFVGYGFYNRQLLNTILIGVLCAAFLHSLVYIFNFFVGNAWDSSGDVERYGGGRESLIIVLGIIMIFINPFTSFNRFLRIFLATLFLIALVIGQTRTIFLQLPFMILFVGWLFKKMNVKMIVKKTFLIAAIAYCFFFLFSVLAPADLILSVKASSVVVFEAFDLQTFQLIFNPNEALNSENWKLFSSSGNTLFRVLAWAQTLDDILSEKLGWLWGLPMGRNYSWVGPGGIFNENMQPHNDYLVIMSRTGISGLIAYLALITYIVNNVRRLVLQGMESKQITILICFLIMLLLFVGLNAEIRSYGMHFWVWFLMGFILREVKLFKEKSYE